MKKVAMIIATILLVGLLGTQVMADNTVSVGYDFNGKDKLNEGSIDINSSFCLGYEYSITEGPLEYGAGIQYQFDREFKNANNYKFNYIPVYGLANYYFNEGDGIKPYLAGKLGYNFLIGNEDFKEVVYTNTGNRAGTGSCNGGLFYGLGFGITYEKFKVELLYSVNNGGLSFAGQKIEDFSYSKVGLSFGYRF
jgi:hypothetical protein